MVLCLYFKNQSLYFFKKENIYRQNAKKAWDLLQNNQGWERAEVRDEIKVTWVLGSL